MASRAEAQARRWAARSTAPGARAAPSPSPEPPSLPEPRRASADEAALWAAELAARLGGARCDAWDPLERAAGLPPDAARGFDVFDAATAESLSYACVAARARRLGTWLSTIGIDAGSVVALVGCNSAAALVAHFAVAGWLGAVVLNANPRLAADELAYILDMAQAKGLLADKAQGALVDSVLASAPSVRCVVWTNVPPEAWLHVGDEYLLRDRDVIVTEYLSIVAGPDGAADAGAASTARRKGAVAGCDNAACEMYFTSGTTGRPKGVVLSRRAVVLHALGCVVEHRLGAGDVWLHAAPMFHLVDAYAIFAVTWVGGRHVTLPRFGGAAFASAVEAHGITVTNVAATMVMLVLADPAAAAADLRSLQLVSCGGAPLSRETVLRAVERFGCEFFLSYGMTECCGKISMSLVDAETRRRCGAAEVLDLVCTSGRHFSLLEVRVVRASGTAPCDSPQLAAGDGDAVDVSPSERGGAVGPEHVGEVWIRGPTLFRGYFGDAAATAEAITPQGWFRTGDVATVNARGYLTITDRAKDMILVGSENVYCVEVERVLHDHAAVEHAAVYGVPDALLGERVKAVVVAAGADISASALRSHVSRHLADFKVPSIIEFIDAADLPMTASGKVAKAKLKRRDEARRRDDEARRRDEARALSAAPASGAADGASRSGATLAALEPLKEHIYTVDWTASPLAGAAGLDARRGHVVVVVDERDAGVGREVVARLGGCSVVTTAAASGEVDDAWLQAAKLRFAAALDEAGVAVGTVVFLSALGARADVEAGADAVAAATEGCLATLLAMLQAAADVDGTKPRVLVATRGAQAAGDDGGDFDASAALAGAAVWGLVRSAQAELPLRLAVTDLCGFETSRGGDADAVVAELAQLLRDESPDTSSRESAWRKRQRLAPSLRRLAVGTTIPAAEERGGVHAAVGCGVHVITGGTGGLGLEWAERLAAAGGGCCTVVLAARRAPDSATAQRLRAMERATGASVFFAQADVAVAADARALVATAHAQRLRRDTVPPGSTVPWAQSPLRVWHLAGVVDNGAVPALTWRRFADVLGPKVRGSLALYDAVAGADCAVDSLVFFSSIYGLLGARELSHYAAANAFQDGLAAAISRSILRRRGDGLRTGGLAAALAVSWGTWAGAGMAHRFGAGFEAVVQATGMRPVPLDAGFAALSTLVAAPFEESRLTSHAAVLPADWAVYAEHRRSTRDGPHAMARALAREAAVTRPGCGPPPRAGRRRAAQSAPDLRALGDGWAADVAVLEPEAQAGLISLRVRAALREVVGDDAAAADADAALATVGVSSLHAVALAAKLAQESDLALSPTLLFECVSIRGIAQHILGLLVEAPPEADHDAAAQRAPGALSVRSGADEARLVIGVLGAACRLPGGVNSPRELWVLLESAAHAVRPPPAGRPSNGRPSGYLDASVLAGFDGAAFHVGAAEACAMDPQQRLCLQCAAEALEASCLFDGGALRAVRGKAVATYVGVTQVDYAAYAGSPSAFTATAVGTTAAVANRVAYALDLRGASVAIDTACSSALVALDAARSRLLQRADVAALVGGVNVQLVKRWSDAFARAGMLSPTHRCAFGDDEADGYVRGEGCAFVTLVAASSAEAVADLRGGIILASTAVNQDGRSNGLTAPNPAAQARMLRAALERAAAPPAHAGGAHAPPGYVEAHGTGTRLGDPIELAALSRVLGGETPLRCASVKSNLGHLECGAGAAALVKVACCLHRERLPPSLHVRVPNRVVDWATCGVVVVTANAAARPQDKRCGASGFGFAGTNAHALLDGRRPRARTADDRLCVEARPFSAGPFTAGPRRLVIRLESHSAAGLRRKARAWARHFTNRRGGADLEDEAELCNDVRRAVYHGTSEACAAVLSARDGDGALATLLDLARSTTQAPQCSRHGAFEWIEPLSDRISSSTASLGTGERVCVVFTGQGAAYGGMGRPLLALSPAFAAALRAAAAAADAALAPGAAGARTDVSGALFDWAPADADSAFKSSEVAQTAQLALQHALFVSLCADGGIEASAAVGHSLGEVAALVCSGFLSLADGMAVAAIRGRAVDGHCARSNGGMLAVGASAIEISAEIGETDLFEIAAENAPRATVVACADAASLAAAKVALERAFGKVTVLAVTTGFHSRGVDAALPALRAGIDALRFPRAAPKMACISALTAAPFEAAPGAEFWVAHARSRVRFQDAIRCAAAPPYGCTTFVEIGPHPQLVRHIEAIFSEAGCQGGVVAVPTLRRRSDGDVFAAVAVALRAARPPAARALPRAASAESLTSLWEAPIAAKIDYDDAIFSVPPPTAFANERRWLDDAGDEEDPAALEDARLADEVVYAVDWVDAPRPGDAPPLVGEAVPLSAAVDAFDVVFPDAAGFVERCLAGPHEAATAVHEAVAAPRLAATIEQVESDVAAVVADVGLRLAAGARVRRVVFGYGLDAGMDDADGCDLLERTTAALLQLLSGLAKLPAARVGRVVVLTRDVHAEQTGPTRRCSDGGAAASKGATLSDGRAVAGGALWGAATVARLELSLVQGSAAAGGLSIRCVDLEGDLEAAMVCRVGAEVACDDDADVRLSPARRAVGRVSRTLASSPHSAADAYLDFGGLVGSSRDAQVLITGGTGALGAAVATWLLRQAPDGGAPRMVLVSRSGETPECAGRLDDLRALAAEKGTSIDVVRCDVGKWADVRALVRARRRYVVGVVHAAGVLQDDLLANYAGFEASARSVFEAKAHAAIYLDRAFAEAGDGLCDGLAFFWLFSSVTALMGNAGQACYGAANGALDALARWRRREGKAALAIQWGPWAERGMARGLAAKLARTSVWAPLSDADALRGLGALLALHEATRGAAPAAVATVARFQGDALRRSCRGDGHRRKFFSRLVSPADGAAKPPSGEKRRSRRLGGAPPRAATKGGDVEGTLRALLQRYARGAKEAALDGETRLSSLGLDSIDGSQIAADVGAAFGFSASPMLLLEVETIGELVARIVDELPRNVQRDDDDDEARPQTAKRNGHGRREGHRRSGDDFEGRLRAVLGKYLKHGEGGAALSSETRLTSLGLDSIDGSQISADVGAAFRFAASPMLLLEVETFGELVSRVVDELPRNAQSSSEEEEASGTARSQGQCSSGDEVTVLSSPADVEDTLRLVLAKYAKQGGALSGETPLDSLGLDSIDGSQVAADVGAALRFAASPMLLLEAATFGELVRRVRAELSADADKHLKTPRPRAPRRRAGASPVETASPVESAAARFERRVPGGEWLVVWAVARVYFGALRMVVVGAACAFAWSRFESTFPSTLAAMVAGACASLAWALACKWTLVGKYRACDSEWRWSAYALRCELATTEVAQVGAALAWALPSDSVFFVWWFRLLGAKVGRGVSISSPGACIDAPDLCVIGDGAVLQRGAALRPTAFSDDGASLTARYAIVGNGAVLGADAVVAGGAVLGVTATAGARAFVQGRVERRVRGSTVDGPVPADAAEDATLYYASARYAWPLQAAVEAAFAATLLATTAGAVTLAARFAAWCCLGGAVAAGVAGYLAFGALACAHAVAAQRLLVGGGLEPSTRALTVGYKLRLEYVDAAAALASNAFVNALFRSNVAQNAWLRCLGADVDWSANVAFFREFCGSTAPLLHIGPDAFLAGMPQFVTSYCTKRKGGFDVTHAAVRVERGGYVGFAATVAPGATVEAGAAVGDLALLGVGATVESGTAFIGIAHASQRVLAFKRGEAAAGGPKQTDAVWTAELPLAAYHAVTAALLVVGLALEVLALGAVAWPADHARRFFERVLVAAVADDACRAPEDVSDVCSEPESHPAASLAAAIAALVLVMPPLRICVGLLFAAVAVLHKWLLVGRVVPLDADDAFTEDRPPSLWPTRSVATACWLAQFRLNLDVDSWLAAFACTEVYSIIWRGLGAAVGKRARIGKIGPPDHDVIAVGNRAYIENAAAVFAHDFAGNGKLAFRRSAVGDDAALFGVAAFLPGAQVGDGVVFGPGTMALRGTYGGGGRYQGNPARGAARDGAHGAWRHAGDGVEPLSDADLCAIARGHLARKGGRWPAAWGPARPGELRALVVRGATDADVCRAAAHLSCALESPSLVEVRRQVRATAAALVDRAAHAAVVVVGRLHDGSLAAAVGRLSVAGAGADDGSWKRLVFETPSNAAAARRGPCVVVMFGGESLYAGVAAALWAEDVEFRGDCERVAAKFEAREGFRGFAARLAAIVAPAEAARDRGDAERADCLAALGVRDRNCAAFAVQNALRLLLLRRCGLRPVAYLGYSIGELAAAVGAGALTEDDVVSLFADTAYAGFEPGGAMAVVSGVDRAALDRAVADTDDGTLVVAAQYSEGDFMVAGRRAAVDALAAALPRGARRTILGDAPHAYHSPLHFVVTRPRVGRAARRPRAPFVSCAGGGFVDEAAPTLCDLGALYTAPVRFMDALDAVVARAAGRPVVLVDLSLKGDLSYYAAAWRAKRADAAVVAVPWLRPRADASTRAVQVVAELALRGARLDKSDALIQ